MSPVILRWVGVGYRTSRVTSTPPPTVGLGVGFCRGESRKCSSVTETPVQEGLVGPDTGCPTGEPLECVCGLNPGGSRVGVVSAKTQSPTFYKRGPVPRPGRRGVCLGVKTTCTSQYRWRSQCHVLQGSSGPGEDHGERPTEGWKVNIGDL